MKPIETYYNGYKFRSRLEARWAVFFDALNVRYEYEKEGYDLDGVWYLPDFWLPDLRYWIEIKGTTINEQEMTKAALLAKHSKCNTYIFMGDPWFNPALAAWIVGDDSLKVYSSHFDFSMKGEKWNNQVSKCHLWAHNETDGTFIGDVELFMLMGGREGLAFFTHPKLVNAYLAARQARFEYGGKP